MNLETITRIVEGMGSYELRHVRDTLNAELEAGMQQGVKGTQAHEGKLEMLAAICAELDTRPVPSLPVDICHEDGVRYAVTVRVF
jgi:hypothetical protein